jgi:hypothetical protein
MACIDREILGRYFDGELDEVLRADVDRHVSACARCTAELAELQALRDGIADCACPAAPTELWSAIERKLDVENREENHVLRMSGYEGQGQAGFPAPDSRLRTPHSNLRRLAAAASIALFLGLVVLAGLWLGNGTTAKADAIDFSVLLDAVNADADAAFDRFLRRYGGAPITPADAHASAPTLDFEVPAELPGGFRRGEVYRLKFGKADGIAAAYTRPDGEFMATIFHPPVRREDFGTHRDYPCAIGQHRGHAVQVGQWRMVHLTDPSTCHCVLTRETADEAIAAVMQAIAPRSECDEHNNH